MKPEDVMSMLAQVAPELDGIEHAHDHNGERLMCEEMSDVATYLVSAKQEDRCDVLTAIFNEIERLIATGHEAVRELLIVGLLEDTQNFSLQAEIPLKEWNRFLGPECKKGWIALERMWIGKMKPADFNQAVAGHKTER